VTTTRDVTVLENAQVRVRITVPGDEVQKEYDSIVADYCSHARIPGFRKGKVPRDVLIRKLGHALFDQTRVEVLEKAVKEALEQAEQKPYRYASPEVKADDPITPGRDWSFELTYDTDPAAELGPYTGLEVEEPTWEIEEEDVERELAGIREQQALFVDKESGVVATGDIVNVDYVELETGAPKEATRREAFVFEVGSGYNYYRFDDDIVGMQKGQTREITKVYPAEPPAPAEGATAEQPPVNKDLAGRSVSLRITVNSVKEKKLPEVNDELAQDISERFKTLDDLKADIRKKLAETVKARLRSRALAEILQRVVATSKFTIPPSVIDYQLELMWQEYVSRTRVEEQRLVALLAEQGQTMEQLRAEWMPAATERARLQQVIAEIAKKEAIALDEGELETEIARIAAERQVKAEELKESLAKNNLMGSIAGNLRLEKLYDFLLSKTTVKPGGRKKVIDILRGE
jgi:trigger factor